MLKIRRSTQGPKEQEAVESRAVRCSCTLLLLKPMIRYLSIASNWRKTPLQIGLDYKHEEALRENTLCVSVTTVCCLVTSSWAIKIKPKCQKLRVQLVQLITTLRGSLAQIWLNHQSRMSQATLSQNQWLIEQQTLQGLQIKRGRSRKDKIRMHTQLETSTEVHHVARVATPWWSSTEPMTRAIQV